MIHSSYGESTGTLLRWWGENPQPIDCGHPSRLSNSGSESRQKDEAGRLRILRILASMPRPKKKYTQQQLQPAAMVRDDSPHRYLNVKQLGEYLGLPTPSAARRAAQAANWKSVKVGKRFTYDRFEVDAWWAEQAGLAA